MTTKTKSKTKDSNAVNVPLKKDKDHDEAMANVLLRPSVQAAITIQQWGNQSDIGSLMGELFVQVAIVKNGDMGRPEAMLLAQAHTLDALFNNLARRAQNQQYIKQFETNLRLAFKAQSQCRATLETLAALKNPPVIFAKQANISNGHQQINNGVPATHTEKTQNQPNELLVEAQHGSETLDTRTTSATIGKDNAMATLE
ncbi:MAG: hypothetical protein EXR80_10760 [Methylococcales bacterium]|nr:hypothetical protein [Methylococcales bacterium]